MEGGSHAEGGSGAAAVAAVVGDVGVDGDDQMIAALLVRGGSPSSWRYLGRCGSWWGIAVVLHLGGKVFFLDGRRLAVSRLLRSVLRSSCRFA